MPSDLSRRVSGTEQGKGWNTHMGPGQRWRNIIHGKHSHFSDNFILYSYCDRVSVEF